MVGKVVQAILRVEEVIEIIVKIFVKNDEIDVEQIIDRMSEIVGALLSYALGFRKKPI